MIPESVDLTEEEERQIEEIDNRLDEIDGEIADLLEQRSAVIFGDS